MRTSAKRRVLEVRGKYQAVVDTLNRVRYKPEPFQNHFRLKSRYLSSATAQKAPFEKMLVQLWVDDPYGFDGAKP